MSKMKKVLAVLLTLAMVMGMAITTFAAGTTATITVEGVNNADSVMMLQIIQPNPTTKTGWEFVNGAEGCFKEAFAPTADEQKILASLIKLKDKDAVFTDAELAAVQAATTEQLEIALSKVANGLSFGPFGGTDGRTTTVDKAGVYVIKATEEGYTYQTMAAYVGFGVAPALVDADPITAKKSSTVITKTNADEDKAVAIGDTVEFTVTTNFPYIDPNADVKEFKITDTLTGADFNLENGVLKGATVTVGTDSVDLIATGENANFVVNGRTFTLDLSEFIDNTNSNAGDVVTIKYTVTVKEVDVNNSVTSTTNANPTVDYVYTGKITFTKFAEDGTTSLKGAGFNVLKDGVILKFTQDKDSKTDADIPGKYTYDPNGSLEEVFVDDNGVVEVKGLDKGIYHFAEKTAPEGYSINANGTDVELKFDGDVATANFDAEGSMIDTKLSALPSTGGIGTTIFTIAGCAIMIAAAGLFFASRRKSVEK